MNGWRDLFSPTRRKERFVAWWHAPATRGDRLAAALVGAWACLVIGVALGFVVAEAHSLSLVTLAWLAAGSFLGGIVLGWRHPKWVLCLAWPFALIGGGGSS